MMRIATLASQVFGALKNPNFLELEVYVHWQRNMHVKYWFLACCSMVILSAQDMRDKIRLRLGI
jgi:hypothetical protein